MFRKILVANRGEIACRVIATARRLAVRTVAVYSDADAQARHVHAADEAVHLGGNTARESYLLWRRIIAAAQSTGAQAIHPGYGFLAENAEFAQACAAAGLVFIGPPPAAIAAMGSKAAAKALMAQAGVPLVPGYHGENNEPAFLAHEAGRIGYPVLIKASAGGGGRGMRRVDRPEDFAAALASCQREAKASFGDDRVLVERYVTRPRHIEIQVFGDALGNVIHLNERDCSVQRRHQKVLEESPAPGLSAARRAELGAAAVAAARAVGYVGAGTVEFVAEERDDGDIRAYFMEMNTRLQVEHPVTEAVTGLDLVEWQLRIADGERLPLTQEQVALRGHAIEARICAENPDAGFLPATGRLAVVRWPEHVAFERAREDAPLPRVDSGFGEGNAVTPYYDSMIAKLIVWGENRATALARLDAALRDTHIVGLHTNIAFLRRVVQCRAFATADLDTGLIERERGVLFDAPPLAAEVVAAGVVAHGLAMQGAHEGADPWSRRDGWRLYGVACRRIELRLGDEAAAVELQRRHDGETRLAIGAQQWVFAARALGDGRHDVQLGERRLMLSVYRDGERYAVYTQDGRAFAAVVDAYAQAGEHAAEAGGLTAPMPGKVLSFAVQAGEPVRRGQALAVIEAMKMEHTLYAPRDGVVAELLCAAGDQVVEGGELLRLEAAQAG
ncbi:MAG: acetyl/propionyl-CoA carboxylase subuit alpha [Pseudomonadota bacterium]|nr:3-methylcrotonyl-CoA carboxylase [Rubrivivax sp.]NLZ41080.1 3-methylcrotonyl-CoA carboxylase [Comamonadaceae bacterium]